MALQYRGVPYTTNQKDGSVFNKTLTYRGKEYSNLHPISGTRRKVDVKETYRGVNHEETITVCG